MWNKHPPKAGTAENAENAEGVRAGFRVFGVFRGLNKGRYAAKSLG